MSIALPALILLAIVLPGYIFAYTYKGTLRNQDAPLVNTASMTMGWALAFIVGIISHVVWIAAVRTTTALDVDFDALVTLLGGNYDDKDSFSRARLAVSRYPLEIVGYFFSLYVASALLGVSLHKLVSKCGLDRKIGLLRFNSPWHYLFSGAKERASGTLLTVSVSHAGFTCLYAGVMDSYVVLADSTLERIVLRAPVFRVSLPTDPKCAQTECEVPGDRFVIWCKDVNTVNINYIFAAVD